MLTVGLKLNLDRISLTKNKGELKPKSVKFEFKRGRQGEAWYVQSWKKVGTQEIRKVNQNPESRREFGKQSKNSESCREIRKGEGVRPKKKEKKKGPHLFWDGKL